MRLISQQHKSSKQRLLEEVGARSRQVICIAGLGLFMSAIAWGAEIRFTTLPEVVRTTVIHETGIPGPDKVVRVVQLSDNIYEISVLTDTGQRIIYVTADGTIVQRPNTTVEEGTESTSGEVIVTMDEIQRGGTRYRFVESQGPDKIYIDQQTNKRVIVKNQSSGAVDQNQGSVRTEGGTNGQNRERNQIGSQRTEERATDQNSSQDQGAQKNQGEMRRDENSGSRGDQKGTTKTPRPEGNTGDQGIQNNQRSPGQNDANKGTQERTGASRNAKGQMSPNEKRGPGDQAGSKKPQKEPGSNEPQKAQGKEKASSTP